MKISLQALTSEPLEWTNTWPPDFKGIGLPGGSKVSATGSFGSICIQEISEPNYFFRLHQCTLKTSLATRIVIPGQGLHTSFTLKGKRSINPPRAGHRTIIKNQFAAFASLGNELNACFYPGFYMGIDAFFSTSLLGDVLHLFPHVNKIMHRKKPWSSHPAWIGHTVLETLFSIIRCKLQSEFRTHFIGQRIEDLLFYSLLALTGQQQKQAKIPEEKLQAIHRAEEIITGNIYTHIPITELARMVSLNKQTLKVLFKQVFDMGPYEYLLTKRFQKAKQLLEQGHTVKEVAITFGYRPSDFSTAFRQFFGYRPSTVLPKTQQ